MSKLVLEESVSLPDNWAKAKLEIVINKITNGTTETQTKEETEYPVSRIETISNESIDYDRVRYLKKPSNTLIEKYALQQGDILFSNINSDTHLGKTAIFYDGKTLIHGMNLLLIRPEQKIIDPKFLNFHFKYYRNIGKFVAIAQHAVNQSSINQTKLRNMEFIVPPLNEQKRIVAKIEELFSLVDSTKENLEKTKTLLKLLRKQLLDYLIEKEITLDKKTQNNILKYAPLSELIIKIIDHRGVTPKKLGSDWKESGIPVISARNIKNYQLAREEEIRFIPEEIAKKWMPENITKGDLLIVSEGATLGELALLNKDTKFCLGQRLFGIRTNPEILESIFLYYYLISPKGKKEIFSRATGSTVSGLRQTALMKLSILLPTLQQQRKIVNDLDRINTWIENIEIVIENLSSSLKSIRNSMLKQAFEGQLVPQDPNDEPVEILLQKIKREKQETISQTAKPRKKNGK